VRGEPRAEDVHVGGVVVHHQDTGGRSHSGQRAATLTATTISVNSTISSRRRMSDEDST
jgi:hypothetical protein